VPGLLAACHASSVSCKVAPFRAVIAGRIHHAAAYQTLPCLPTPRAHPSKTPNPLPPSLLPPTPPLRCVSRQQCLTASTGCVMMARVGR
jgi:hypothetical protein